MTIREIAEPQPLRNTAPVAPLLISELNAVAVTGRKWPWVLATAKALGVPVATVRRRPVIPAQSFMDAVMAAGVPVEQPGETSTPSEPASADDVLSAVGLQRRGR